MFDPILHLKLLIPYTNKIVLTVSGHQDFRPFKADPFQPSFYLNIEKEENKLSYIFQRTNWFLNFKDLVVELN